MSPEFKLPRYVHARALHVQALMQQQHNIMMQQQHNME
jgi:hypothetical protein